MRHFNWALAVVMLFVLCGYSAARATDYNVTFCFKYEIDYDDAQGGDYWTDDYDKPARGIYVKITRNSDGATMFQDWTDSDDGCAPTLVLSTNRHYTITAYLMAKLSNDNSIFVKSDEIASVYSKVLSTDFTPNPNHSGPYNYCYPDGTENGQNAVYLAAAAGFGLHRKPGGVSDEMLNIINHACPTGDYSCLSGGFVYISSGSRDNKYVILHEIGHWIGYERNGEERWEHDYDLYDDLLCPAIDDSAGHDLLSMEEQRAAINEGWAQFYAAATWNDEEESDCEFYTLSNLDYNRDGYIDFIYSFSCLPGTGYENTYCTSYNIMSTEYDWMRFFWMWHHGGKSIGSLVEVIVDSNPTTWQCGTPAQCYAVYTGLRYSAITGHGYSQVTWDLWAPLLGLFN
ncbi:MAG: hypothetical protein GX444_11460 [Myxococcales bacterium]|nr:hypothetical protein [Myxococcales bacterium]